MIVELALRSPSCEVFVPVQYSGSARSPKELAVFSTLPLEEVPSRAGLRLQNTLPPVPIDAAINVVEVPVSAAFTILPPVKTSDFEKIEYRAGVLDVDYSDRVARRTDLKHAEKLRTMIRKGKWVNDFGSFSVGE